MAIVILILSAVGVGIATRGPSLSMPEALAGHPRLHGPTVHQIEQGAEEAVGPGTVVGLCHKGGRPRFAVLAADSFPPPGEDPLREAVAGFDQPGAVGSLDAGSRMTRRIGSVMYSCASYSVSTGEGSFSATLCDWNDGESYGLVMSYDPTIDASELTPDVYEAVVE